MSYRVTPSVLLALCMLVSLPIGAQESAASEQGDTVHSFSSVIDRYPSGAINSTEIADQALADVKRQRTFVDARFAEDEAICYEKFFVTACTDAAKERRRTALKQLESIEVEANAYNRRARVEKRDQALRERQAELDAQAFGQARTQAKDGSINSPATSGEVGAMEDRARQTSSVPSAATTKNFNRERAAEHAQVLEREREEERSQAQKRAENIRAYEKKQQRSLERQREIAAKKEEKEKAAKERERAAEKER